MLLRALPFSILLLGITSIWQSVKAETVSDALQACSTETNSLKRLVCFDRIVKNMRQYEGLDDTVARSLPVPTNTVRATPTPTRPIQESNQEIDNFGLEPEPEASTATMVDGKLFAMIMATKQIQSSKYQFTLDNGQIWEQTNAQIGGVPKAGDRVSIESGILGAFFLSKEGANKRFRVKRIQ